MVYVYDLSQKFANLVNCHELIFKVSRLRASHYLQYQNVIVRSTLVPTQGSRKNKVYVMVESRIIRN